MTSSCPVSRCSLSSPSPFLTTPSHKFLHLSPLPLPRPVKRIDYEAVAKVKDPVIAKVGSMRLTRYHA